MKKVVVASISLFLAIISFLILSYFHKDGPYVSYISYDYGISDSRIDTLNKTFSHIDSDWQPVIFREGDALRIHFFPKSTFKRFPKELSSKVIEVIKADSELRGNGTGSEYQ